ncbi:glycosyltransferase [Candidatus Uhrbacteria bacterium]|nr:glycosyltransferase [Candidatus Uhrbacteria bacterium]
MRIAVLTNDYPPDASGGAGVIAAVYTKALRAKGHELRVFTRIPKLEDRSMVHRLVFHLQDLGADTFLANEISEWSPDLLLTHNLTGCGFATPRLVARNGIAWVHVLHDVQLIEPSGQIVHGENLVFIRRMWRRIWAALRTRALGCPSGVVSPTAWLLDVHRQYGFFHSSSTTVIPNPIPVERPQEPATSSQLSRPVTFLFVGRLSRDKGIDLLLSAWKQLGAERPNLHIVGDGPFRNNIESLDDPLIVFHGPLPHDQVVRLMSECQALVVPSRVYENQPTVILEALAAGCRVAAARVGGIPETLGEAGLTFLPGDADALTDVLRRILRSGPTEPERAVRELVSSRHRVEVAAGALESFLKSNLKTRNFHPSSD